MKRTRLRVCRAKRAFSQPGDASTAAAASALDLRPYRCDRCRAYHLTSRRKGKRIPRPAAHPPSAVILAEGLTS